MRTRSRSRRLISLVAVAVTVLAAGPATATTAVVDVQANQPQVQGNPTSNTSARFPTNKQNETTIARDPVSGVMIAGANDEQRQPPCGPGPVRGTTIASDCSFFPGIGTSGIYTSPDGVTWTNRGLLDDQASWQGKGVLSDGDPVIAFGPKPDGRGGFSYANGARAYYSSLASVTGSKGFESIIVSSSDNDGATWSAPVVVTTKTSSVDFNDKNWIGVDDSPASPFFGRVYVSWTEFRSNTATGNGSEPIMVAVSTDGSQSFGAPKQLSPAGNNGTGNGRQGSAVTTGPDGTVYVAFEQASSQVLTVSRDGGQKWSGAAPIAPVTDIDAAIPGSNFRTSSFPAIAADPRPGSTTLYATWATKTAAGGRIVLATSTDRGGHWTAPQTVSGAEGYAFFPGIDVAPNGRVDVAYQALVAANPAVVGTGNAKIDSWAVTKSAGGAVSAPVKISTASSDPAASAQNNLQLQFWGDYASVVSGADRAWYVYTDSRAGAGCPAVDAYQKFLHDTGVTLREDGEDVFTQRSTGVNTALAGPVSKPAPGLVCPANFGNTDVFVASFTP